MASTSAMPDLAATRWLREHDKIGGYLPLLALPPEPAAAWAELGVAARTLDERSETHGPETGLAPPLVLELRPELAPILVAGMGWSKVEAALYSDNEPRPVADYFELMYPRAFCPVYVAAVLAMPDEDRRWLEAFSFYAGCGAQLIDDTLDLIEDVGRGLMFITTEELASRSMTVTDLGTATGLRTITELRNQWALAFFRRAYQVTNAFVPENRRLARSWLDFGLRALLDGRVRPLPPDVLADHRLYMRHFGALTSLFDLPFPTESCRTAVARPFVAQVIRRYRLSSWNEIEAASAAHAAPLPSALMVEQVHGVPSVDLSELPDHQPDGRQLITLVHYAPGGLLPTALDVMRVLSGL